MSNKNFIFKKTLTALLLVSVFAATAFFLGGCLASEIPEITIGEGGEIKTLQNTISVRGTGSVKLLPDETFINISAISERPTSQEAVDNNSRLSQAIIDRVENVDAENLKIETIGYELTPLYDYSKEDTPPEIYAYRVTSTIEAKTTELEKIGEIIAAATEAGATAISSIGFDLTDATRRTAKNDALAAATTDANDKAIAIANSMGLKIDSVLFISEEEVYFPTPLTTPAGLGDAKLEAVAAPTILPQEMEVSATINVAYLFTK